MSYRTIYILCSLMATLSALPDAKSGKADTSEKWVALQDCSLQVNGSTNVNRFSCVIQGYENRDTLICYKTTGKNTAVVMSGVLRLPVFNFNCSSSIMTSDLRKTLKAKAFPDMVIRFISLSRYPEQGTDQPSIGGIINIELAGVSKRYEVNYHIFTDEEQLIHLAGNQKLRFSDFNLPPPQKMGGLIKADDELNVGFQIRFKVLKY